jgi:hypothetical protein
MITIRFLDLDAFRGILDGIDKKVVGRHHEGGVALAPGHPAYF